jgi:hypothetical protein
MTKPAQQKLAAEYFERGPEPKKSTAPLGVAWAIARVPCRATDQSVDDVTLTNETGVRPVVPVFQVAELGLQRRDSHSDFLAGRSISSYDGTWVLSDQDSSATPQIVQTASPVCGTKNFSSVRLYSAPQLH